MHLLFVLVSLFLPFFSLYEKKKNGIKYKDGDMMVSVNEEINADGLKKTVEYNDLVEIKNLHTLQVFHIPAYFFPQEYLDTLSYSCVLRDEEFFCCSFCGELSFFSGFCSFCNNDNHPFVKWKVKEYEKYELQKWKFKERFLKMVKSGKSIPDRFKVSYVRSA